MKKPTEQTPAQKKQDEEALQTQLPMSEKDEVKQAEENTTPPPKEDTDSVLADIKNQEGHQDQEKHQ